MSVHRTIENVYIRQEAVQLTRRNFWRLLSITVIITCITDVLNWALTSVGDLLTLPEVTQVVDQYALLVTSMKMTSSEPLLNAITELFLSPKFILFNLVYMAVMGLVKAGLSFGHTRQLIDAGRGGYPEPLRIFTGMKYCLKAWGVELWTGLFATLWFLPGLGVMLLGSELTMYGLEDAGHVVMAIGVALFLVLILRAVFRYAMAPFLLADEPDRGIRDCVKTSTGLMQGRLWQYIRLCIPVTCKYLGATMLANMVFRLIGTVFSMDIQTATVVQAVLEFAATVYFIQQAYLVRTVFYLHTRRPVTLDGAPKPVSYWLREHTETDIDPDEPETSEHGAAETMHEDISATNEEAKETEL